MKKVLLMTLSIVALSAQAHTPLQSMSDWRSAFMPDNASAQPATPAPVKVAPAKVAPVKMASPKKSKPAKKMDEFTKTIKAAKAGYKANLKANMAWRDTGKMIKAAKKLYKSGDNDEAVALAKRALTQTENAREQAAAAEFARPRF